MLLQTEWTNHLTFLYDCFLFFYFDYIICILNTFNIFIIIVILNIYLFPY